MNAPNNLSAINKNAQSTRQLHRRPNPSLYQEILTQCEKENFFLPHYFEHYTPFIYDFLVHTATENINIVNFNIEQELEPIDEAKNPSPVNTRECLLYLNKALHTLPPATDLLSVNSAAFAQHLILDFKAKNPEDDLLALSALIYIVSVKYSSLRNTAPDFALQSPKGASLEASHSAASSNPTSLENTYYDQCVYLNETLNVLSKILAKETIKEWSLKSPAYKKYTAYFMSYQLVTKIFLDSKSNTIHGSGSQSAAVNILSRININENNLSVPVKPITQSLIKAYSSPNAQESAFEELSKFEIFLPRVAKDKNHLVGIENYLILSFLNSIEINLSSRPRNIDKVDMSVSFFPHLSSIQKSQQLSPFLSLVEQFLPYTYSTISFNKTLSSLKEKQIDMNEESKMVLTSLVEKEALSANSSIMPQSQSQPLPTFKV